VVSAIQLFPEHVVVLRWPEQESDVARLARHDVPHLLLVEPGAPPPEVDSCISDWVRLPAEDADVRSRLHSLAQRASRHPMVPELGEFGEFSFRGQRVFLSPTDERIARVLVASFDHGVAEDELFSRVWGRGGTAVKVRVHVSRLRKRVLPLGLEITSIRGYGYRLHRAPVCRADEALPAAHSNQSS
jgi:hypothetical protein